MIRILRMRTAPLEWRLRLLEFNRKLRFTRRRVDAIRRAGRVARIDKVMGIVECKHRELRCQAVYCRALDRTVSPQECETCEVERS